MTSSAPLFCLLAATVVLSLTKPCEAHLIAANRGTINVSGNSVYSVLSLPTSALWGTDDNHDGVIDNDEFQRHQEAIRQQIDRRFVVSNGAKVGHTERLDLVLSPQHEAAQDRAEQVVMLKHTTFEESPSKLVVLCDLYGPSSADQEFTITATKTTESGKESQKATLSTSNKQQTFWAVPSASVPSPPPPPASPMWAAGIALFFSFGAWRIRNQTK